MPTNLPPLTALRAFECAARHLSFAAAAKELHITPAALSFQIRTLEDHLQVKLFHRLNRAVELTEAGKALFPGLREGFERMRQAMRNLERVRPSNIITVATGPAIAAKWLVPHLGDFLIDHAGLDVRVAASFGMGDFEHDDVDIALRFGQTKPSERLFIETVAHEAILPLATPEIRASLKSPEDMARFNIIHDATMEKNFGVPAWKTWLAAANVKKVDPDHGLIFSHADHAIEAANEGQGILCGRIMLASRDILRGRLVPLFKPVITLDLMFYLACPSTIADMPNIEAFRSWVKTEMKKTEAEVWARVNEELDKGGVKLDKTGA